MAFLPEKLREILDSSENLEKMEGIGEKHRLHLDQIADLDGLITEVILGAEKRENFVSELSRRASLDRELAQKITLDVNQEIFIPLRELLKQETSVVSEKDVTAEEEEENISREDLLREIENPEPVSWRQRPAKGETTGSSLVGTHSDKILGQLKPSVEILREASPLLLEPSADPSHELSPPTKIEAVPAATPKTEPKLKEESPKPNPTPKLEDRLTTIVENPRTVMEVPSFKRGKDDPYREPLK